MSSLALFVINTSDGSRLFQNIGPLTNSACLNICKAFTTEYLKVLDASPHRANHLTLLSSYCVLYQQLGEVIIVTVDSVERNPVPSPATLQRAIAALNKATANDVKISTLQKKWLECFQALEQALFDDEVIDTLADDSFGLERDASMAAPAKATRDAQLATLQQYVDLTIALPAPAQAPAPFVPPNFTHLGTPSDALLKQPVAPGEEIAISLHEPYLLHSSTLAQASTAAPATASATPSVAPVK